MSRRRQSNNFNFHKHMLAFNRKAKRVQKVKEKLKENDEAIFKNIDLTESNLRIDHPVRIIDIHELSQYSMNKIHAVNNSLKSMLNYEYFDGDYLKHSYDLIEIVKLFEMFYDDNIMQYKSWGAKSAYRKKTIIQYMLNKYHIQDINQLKDVKANINLEDKIPFTSSVYKLTGKDIAMSLLNINEAKNISSQALKDFDENKVTVYQNNLNRNLDKHKQFVLNGKNIQFLLDEYLTNNLSQIKTELILQSVQVTSVKDLKQKVANWNGEDLANSIADYVLSSSHYVITLDNIIRSLKMIFNNLENNFDELENFIDVFLNNLTSKNGNNILDVLKRIIVYLSDNNIDDYNAILDFFSQQKYKQL